MCAELESCRVILSDRLHATEVVHFYLVKASRKKNELIYIYISGKNRFFFLHGFFLFVWRGFMKSCHYIN